MEVSAIASTLPAMPYGEVRAARADARSAEETALPNARSDLGAERAARPVAEARETDLVKELEAAREAREERERLVNATAGGSFQFEMEGKTRVMKVLDSRDVLIYQVPPQGVLELIEARDREPPPQVRTSV